MVDNIDDVAVACPVERNNEVDQNDTAGIRVFVYGTLKRGHGNNTAISDQTYLGRCAITGPFTMINLGYYPGVVRTTGASNRIFGEVWRVDTDSLNIMDMIEGHPNFYERIKVGTPWKSAWIYTLPEDYLDGTHPVLEGGLWEPSDEEVAFYGTVAEAG